MILAIYRKDGKIERVEDVNMKRIEVDIPTAVKEYNDKRAADGRTAEVNEYSDDSLEAHLYSMKVNRDNNFREQLYDIAHVMRSLDDRLRWLQEEIDSIDGGDADE